MRERHTLNDYLPLVFLGGLVWLVAIVVRLFTSPQATWLEAWLAFGTVVLAMVFYRDEPPESRPETKFEKWERAREERIRRRRRQPRLRLVESDGHQPHLDALYDALEADEVPFAVLADWYEEAAHELAPGMRLLADEWEGAPPLAFILSTSRDYARRNEVPLRLVVEREASQVLKDHRQREAATD